MAAIQGAHARMQLWYGMYCEPSLQSSRINCGDNKRMVGTFIKAPSQPCMRCTTAHMHALHGFVRSAHARGRRGTRGVRAYPCMWHMRNLTTAAGPVNCRVYALHLISDRLLAALHKSIFFILACGRAGSQCFNAHAM